ncbi:MAG: Asp-tRNA(Asn)/Glu-tRNA(Gln) amidotransferase subunit GatB [Opitutales bacterium]
MQYEAVIGLEVHVQVKTRSKMFTRAPYAFGQAPNTLTNPVVMGLPGALPVLNEEAIRQVARMGLLYGCQIAERCKWDRKNYFYPDSPKNYQISQYDQPLCIGGEVEIELPGASRNVMGTHRMVKLTRIHLEEDVGKLTHFPNDSLVDYNRAGAALAEMVTEPDLHNSDEVVAFLNALRVDLFNAGISDCDMEKGQLRCDANISVRPAGSDVLNTRTEMKNLNSVSAVKASVDYEIKRQIRVCEEGGKVTQETRRWNPETGHTSSLRGKEEAHDYRYFPDPDLMPVQLPRQTVDALRAVLPERLFDCQRRFFEQYALPYTVTSVLCPNRELVHFFEAAVRAHDSPQAIANWMTNDLLRELSASAAEGEGMLPLERCPIRPEQLAGLVALIDAGALSKQIAKEVFVEMFQTGQDAAAIVEAKGLKQTSDAGELEQHCREAIEANAKAADEFRAGKEKAINALKGKVMKATRGQANPEVVDATLRRLLTP